MYRKFGKRLIDIVVSFLWLIVLMPLLLILAILIRFKLGSPILFKQDRPGLNGKIFRLYKFRTMTDERNEYGELLPDEERLTSFGKTLRATSMDELPELWNILKGNMSLVGPRPLLVEYLPLYSTEQLRRHNVRPGLTGHAQINGRNAINWSEKFRYDCWYVDNLSFWLDMKVIFLTVAKVFSRKGISSSTSVTMERFKGGDEEASC